MNINFIYKGLPIIITDIVEVNGVNIGTACENTTLLELRTMLENYIEQLDFERGLRK